jgi:hypothetical protein
MLSVSKSISKISNFFPIGAFFIWSTVKAGILALKQGDSII